MEKNMNGKEVGARLVELFNKGDFETIYGELYSPEIKSYEADDPNPAVGMEGINAKNEWWSNTFDVHSMSATGPYHHGDDRFAVRFDMDITHKESGHRSASNEVGVYTIADGRVVEERFFYSS
jgi:ketosteroid isomerase-like protein